MSNFLACLLMVSICFPSSQSLIASSSRSMHFSTMQNCREEATGLRVATSSMNLVSLSLHSLSHTLHGRAPPGEKTTRATRSRCSRKELKKAYSTLLDAHEVLYIYAKQLELQGVVTPPTTEFRLACQRGLNRPLSSPSHSNEAGFHIGDNVKICHQADTKNNDGREGYVVGTTAQFVDICFTPSNGIAQYKIRKKNCHVVRIIDTESVSLDTSFSDDSIDDGDD